MLVKVQHVQLKWKTWKSWQLFHHCRELVAVEEAEPVGCLLKEAESRRKGRDWGVLHVVHVLFWKRDPSGRPQGLSFFFFFSVTTTIIYIAATGFVKIKILACALYFAAVIRYKTFLWGLNPTYATKNSQMPAEHIINCIKEIVKFEAWKKPFFFPLRSINITSSHKVNMKTKIYSHWKWPRSHGWSTNVPGVCFCEGLVIAMVS